ncbi:protein FAR-RED IMPAIRED RESPONSE 1-like [Arachis stenosperma]|uniref:protein FAR-RED IMPAIRED RESPONSE 1-like n=1 Tax=Arachis stenosperma TaxID=217475 RepID=UPI0025AC5813|nr:protein FAR-RED IMPAIRED RESPONSE 1-like [Arachis stenosperma]
MDDSTSDYQLNQGKVDFEFESNKVPEPLSVVDEQLVPKVGMTFKTLEDAAKFYKDYAKAASFSTRDVRNYITREVRNVLEQEDVKKFEKYLLRMKEKNQNFFFELELEDDQSIKLAFWANARSRAAFEYFGDVISFDTTYNTNRYNLVCGSFIGVNHHGQSILLGCALMKNEAIESFKWLFQCWLHCMGENAPKGFLTDQCASIKRAIEACMPTTIHRWCIWHITKKIPSKLNRYKGHAEIEQELSQVVWNSHSKDSFDRNWNYFLLNFGLVDNKWLSESEELTEILYRVYDNVMVEMESLKAKRKGTSSLSHEDANLESVNELQSSPMIRTRGHPKNRLGSKLDKQIANASKKKNTKALNELNVFDAASVVRPNSNQFRQPTAGDNFLGV